MIFYPDILGRLVCPLCGFILLRTENYPYIFNCPKCGEKIDKPEPAEVHHETPITSKNVNEIQFTVNGVKIMHRVQARPFAEKEEKMKKTFCDRCGKEIKCGAILTNSGIVWLKITKSLIPCAANTEEKVDLCEECHAAVYNFIFNNKEEPTE